MPRHACAWAHAQENGSAHSGSSGAGSEEAGRLEAAWAHKSALNRGLSMFNHGSPIKAVRFLIAQGIVQESPQARAPMHLRMCMS